MEPAVISIILKANHRRKRLPFVGEMVRIGDRRGLFVVMRVDSHQRVADLLHRVGKREELETGVSFSLIQAVSRRASRAIQNFLHS